MGFEFSVSVYGKIEKYNDVLSKSRCRIFYKYKNRNGTYITDEFAEELLSTVSYTPVKGIYDVEGQDYTDHGALRSQGRIYGIVPENPNIAWETHLDEDGVERQYACVDVLLFTALYSEANEIVGKSQSMELYLPSIKYHQEVMDGRVYKVFDKGCFLGLQVLGDECEPCFEGAEFFALQENIEEVIRKIQSIESTYSKKGEIDTMKLNFKLSDSQKYDLLWKSLNSEYNEAGDWVITYTICDVYDDYALAFNYEKNSYERVYYTKEEDKITISSKVDVRVLDITEAEYNTIQTLRRLNGDTYEVVSETLTNAEDNASKISDYSLKISELEANIATLQSEKETLQTNYDNSENRISELEQNIESLNAYKLEVEKEQKEAVVSEYSSLLDEEILNSYREKFEELSAEQLDRELAYELKKNNKELFSNGSRRAPKSTPLSGLDAVLAKYAK